MQRRVPLTVSTRIERFWSSFRPQGLQNWTERERGREGHKKLRCHQFMTLSMILGRGRILKSSLTMGLGKLEIGRKKVERGM